MTQEMGKPIVAAEAEVEKCATVCEFYASTAERFLCPQEIQSDAHRSYVRYDPLGPILAIMPWNFPFWQVFRFAAPSLAAGNVGVLKHASNVLGTALAIEQVFRQAGFPKGCFSTLLVAPQFVQELISHPVIRAVTLTGSEQAGIAVARAAGQNLKKTVLELGGSDPFIVLADADIAKVASVAADARCINSGQSCIAAKRFIVLQSVVDAFESAFVAAMQRLKVGDPMDRSTDMGPLSREDLLETLDRQVQASVASGARLLAGGHRLTRQGWFYEPTVLTDVRPGMAAFEQEVFGPVAAVIRARDADDAVKLANQSSFGLGASIWTGDILGAESLAARIEAGMVFINGPVKSDPRLPFGGVKRSGYGRELSDVGIKEFVNIKTVWIGQADRPSA
jgi:succinate-semialdehyde dehydrogenase/glutarate-semialdehyde dehydrogenase